jgi:hypothetical protein
MRQGSREALAKRECSNERRQGLTESTPAGKRVLLHFVIPSQVQFTSLHVASQCEPEREFIEHGSSKASASRPVTASSGSQSKQGEPCAFHRQD